MKALVMATPKKRKGTKKRRGKIKFSQTARLVERNDATRVAKRAKHVERL